MKMKKLRILITMGLIAMVFSCEDPWDNHLDEFSTDRATQDLLEIIQSTPELSVFSGLITQAAAEDLFVLSQVKTVWAPDDEALANLSADISGNTEKLLQFLKNHMTSGMHPQSVNQEEFRCKMLSGKRVPVNMTDATIYGEQITGEFNKIATNGILHMVDQVIDLRPNIWEYIEAAETGNDQIDYLNSITGELFIDSLAVIIDFDPVTSEPIYDTISGTVWYNQYLFENADLRNEDSLFTFLICENDVFSEQYDRFAPYLNLQSTDQRDTALFIKQMVSIDLVSSGLWKEEDIMGSLTSVNGIEVPFEGGAVLKTVEASNGIIYHLGSCDLPLENKFPPIIIEAEDENKTIYTGGGSDGFTRIKPLASGGFDFVLDDHDASPGRVVYQAGMVAAAKYNFYWKAVDDFGGSYYGAEPDSLIRQKIEKVIYLPGAPLETRFPVHRSISDSLLYVEDFSYEEAEERYAGTYTFKYYEDFWLHLVGSGPNTTLTLDYLKIVPVFE